MLFCPMVSTTADQNSRRRQKTHTRNDCHEGVLGEKASVGGEALY